MSGELKGACIFGQSGGPTAVINASAYGVLKTALESDAITNVYGAAHGIRGVLDDRLYDIGQEEPDELRLLLHTPSSELGSCRYKMADPDTDDTDYRRILEIFRKYNVRYFFYNGGNDSMDTCNKISRYMQAHDWDCRVMGVPKTIDNDLFGTDHCPGFASAAKYIATSCMEVSKDCRVYDTGTITVVEIMGRHAGWLAGSAALASACGSGPDLIYLPEVDFDMEQFLADVHRIYQEKNNVLIAVSEGIHYADGSFVSEAKASATDGFGHAQLGGLAARLAQVIKEHEHAKVRGIELSLLQRAGAHLASQTDIDEAFAAGKMAVEAALSGETGKMVAFERETDTAASEPVHAAAAVSNAADLGAASASCVKHRNTVYKIHPVLKDVNLICNQEKKVPAEWITKNGTDVSDDFLAYPQPLIQGDVSHIMENGLPKYLYRK